MPILRAPARLYDWPALEAVAPDERWHPCVFERGDPEQREAMDALVARDRVTGVFDRHEAQLEELVRVRAPDRELSRAELSAELEALAAPGGRGRSGRWVYYPWSGRLVHVLEPARFRELRSDRNRYKITPAEQTALASLRVGIVGLSVGNAVANTLALEGAFGELRLADFDTLSLSNTNRVRCGVHELGLNKAILCARQIYEQDPYARLVLYTDGITRDNVSSFLDAGGALDVVVDECDDLMVKVLLREEARRRRVPVIMETSDRGLLDIERFDQEPARPLLHGLLEGYTSSSLASLSRERRLELIAKIVGVDTLSPRAAASLLEIGASVRGVAQLGSDVALGGASATIAVRSVALGHPAASGRAWIDVRASLASMRAPGPREAPAPIAAVRPGARGPARGVLDALLERAGASSCVSWSIDGDRVLVLRLAELDPGDAIAPRTRWIAAGAALERVLVEARRSGLWLRERLRLDSEDDGLVATLERVDEPRARSGSPWPLVGSRGLNDDLVDALERTARAAGGHLRVILRGARHEAMARALAEAERLALLTPGLSARARDDYEGSGGGARLATALLRDPEARALVRAIDGGRTLVCASLRALSESDGVALLSVPDATRASLVAGGRARARLRMFLETCSIRARPMGAALHVLTVDPARELTPRERATVQELRERLDALLDGGFTDGVPVALLRLADDDRGAPR